ncbi:MAG: FIST N-terminal domain-containing protein [Gammaproteobacteria bacterium]|jgi:small ligand-binding sensory domain FIST
MQEFYSISSQQHSVAAVIEECEQLLGNAPSAANFGFIYATDEMSSGYEALLQACRERTAVKHWVGSLGIGIIASGKEIYDMPAASIMLAEFDANEFSILPLIRKPNEIASKFKTPHPFTTSFMLIHGDPLHEETQNLIQRLHQSIDNAFIVGGLTSSREKQLQIADEICSGGISGVIFSENIGVLTNLSQGCSPVGSKHRITRAQENVAFTLDQKPALNVMMEDIGVADYDELKQTDADVFVGLCIPCADVNDYTVRNLVGVDFDHHVFAINDYLNEGSELVFCRRDNQSAVEDMQRMLDNISARLENTPKGGVYISCLGRGREQFGHNAEEVKMIHEKLGDFPLTGFFANGEIHHDKLYGYTGVLALFI